MLYVTLIVNPTFVKRYLRTELSTATNLRVEHHDECFRLYYGVVTPLPEGSDLKFVNFL